MSTSLPTPAQNVMAAWDLRLPINKAARTSPIFHPAIHSTPLYSTPPTHLTHSLTSSLFHCLPSSSILHPRFCFLLSTTTARRLYSADTFTFIHSTQRPTSRSHFSTPSLHSFCRFIAAVAKSDLRILSLHITRIPQTIYFAQPKLDHPAAIPPSRTS